MWCIPIFLLQLNFNRNIINNNKKLITKSLIYSTCFLVYIDKFAIKNNIWIINSDFTINSFTNHITIMPIEILFFIYTSCMCIFKLTLFITINITNEKIRISKALKKKKLIL